MGRSEFFRGYTPAMHAATRHGRAGGVFGRSFVRAAAVGACAGIVALGGCIERRIRITSEPPGALVHLNDVEIGRTPVEAAFTFHGEYDVRLDLEGHEPVWTSRKAKAPWYELPLVDLVAEAAPRRFRNHQHWHFELEPAAELADTAEFEAGLIERANELRARVPGAMAEGERTGDETGEVAE